MDINVITPRFSETDALGHISNTVLPIWFGGARDGFFRRVHPSQTYHDWPVIMARMEVDLKAQIYLGSDVTIKTSLRKIGTSSMHVYQEAFQNNKLVAAGLFINVYFDFTNECSKPIPDDVRERLLEMIIE